MSGRPSQAAQLKWHNTLPEDFTSRRAVSNPVPPPHSVSVRKRLPMSAETMIPSDALMDDGRRSAEIMNDTIIQTSPSKRHRATTRVFHTKTPTKSIRTGTDSGTYSGSGMQTPPPSSAGTMRKRGRLSQRVPPVSHAARVASPPQTSPPKLRAVSTSALNSEYLTHAGKPALADGRAKAIFWNDGLDLGRGSAGHNQFDWNSLRGNLFPEEIAEILSSESSFNTEQSSSEHTDSASDCVHFSFAQVDDTDFAPIAVDPNLIFSEPSSTTSSMTDGYSNARNDLTPSQRPYQHQRLQRQREHEERTQRRLQTQHGDELDRTTQRLGRSRSRTSIGSHSSRSSCPLTLRRTADYPNINSGPFGQGRAVVPVHSSLGTVRRPSSSWSTKSRAEVMLEISADGRAQTRAGMAYMSDLAGEGDTSYWDSFDESDSSLDGDTPRGLAPDGSEYTVYRRRSALGSMDTKSSVSKTASKKNLQPQRLQFTPQKTSSSLTQLTTAAATGRRKIESSPRLPTPMRSSPPASTHQLGAMRSPAEESTPQLPQLGDAGDSGSEAETVMDEEEPLEGDDTDALAALKKVLARNRDDIPANGTPAKSRPGSAVKRSYSIHGCQTVPVMGYSTYDPFASSPIKSEELAIRTPRRRRHLADGGYHRTERDFRGTSPTTVTDPNCASDRDISDIGLTHCDCGEQDDGGKTMVQCDSCHNWSHLRCIGFNRKNLPKEFVCVFCVKRTTGRKRGLTRVKSAPLLNYDKTFGQRAR